MRCALSYDENKDLTDQKLSAWGEMQSLEEDPAYKEEDIKDEKEREYFFGYKMAVDDMCKNLVISKIKNLKEKDLLDPSLDMYLLNQ